jgi:hypothetical protein
MSWFSPKCVSLKPPTIFTHNDDKKGFIGTGRLPINLFKTLTDILKEFVPLIPDTSKTTFHTYYSNLRGSLKENFDKIQRHFIWRGICNTNTQTHTNTGSVGGGGGSDSNCILRPVTEMNEIYYSNPKPKFETNTRLYGAAANLLPHKDCILFNFIGIRFYRVIIGLTSNNTDTITHFIDYNISHYINKGQYIIFDFDRTFHKVIKTGLTETPRVLLKLHFIVCRNCIFNERYVNFVAYFYKYYYYVARYTEEIGTDPTSWVGVFIGTMWEWPFYPSFKYTMWALMLVCAWWYYYCTTTNITTTKTTTTTPTTTTNTTTTNTTTKTTTTEKSGRERLQGATSRDDDRFLLSVTKDNPIYIECLQGATSTDDDRILLSVTKENPIYIECLQTRSKSRMFRFL